MDKDGKNSKIESINQKEKGDWKQCCEGKAGEWCDYFTGHKKQSIAYAVLTLGVLLLLFSESLYGGLLIGAVVGAYFSNEILFYLRNIGQLFRGPDQVRYVIVAVLVLGLLIAFPGLVLGAVIIAALKQVLGCCEK